MKSWRIFVAMTLAACAGATAGVARERVPLTLRAPRVASSPTSAGQPFTCVTTCRASIARDMGREARDFGLPVDMTSLHVVSIAEGVFAAVSVVGLQDLIGPTDFLDGADVGLVYNGLPSSDLPMGYYLHRVFLDDPAGPSLPRIVLVDRHGVEFDMPATGSVIPGSDPFTETGPRGTLEADVGAVRAKKYITCEDIDLLALWCIELTVTPD